MKNYNPQTIEKKWQRIWEKTGIFRTSDKSKKPKFYCLGMFPYPSAQGIHIGHLKNYTFSDLIAKKKKMENFNVLHPMGWDAFGLPAENYALKTGIHPAITTKKAIKNMKRQISSVGFGYDWQREVCTSDPGYYKWTQWLFLQFYKAGLAYQKEAKANFCPSCKTVLANEQVIEDKCERCGSLIEKKYLKQWFFKITNYAERLLNDLEKVDWPEKIKIMQKNWIGKSEGITIKFEILNSKFEILVFTTRADTLFGCTYLVLAPEYPLLQELKSKINNWSEVEKYIKKAISKTDIERLTEDREKTGIKCEGIMAINPINNQEVPIFVADYILMEYGTGAIMAVPAHDQRDFVFAKKYGLAIKEVIKPEKEEFSIDKNDNVTAFEEDGVLINSGFFSGMESAKAREEIAKYLIKREQGKKVICYKLRDWLISRQRYWGCPIPIIHCSKCGESAVLEKDLPVELPYIKDFKPSGEGKSPLAKLKKFVEIKCPKCHGPAERETDTLDTFACSSWYFLRYTDSKNKKEFADERKIKNWLPVNMYIGGAEHAVLHLLYARFFTKTLKDLDYLNFDEPFSKLFNQGMIYYQGAKMSKSKGNVVDPDEMIKKYGADTLRLYICFMGPSDQAVEWSDEGIVGCYRFLQKVWNLFEKLEANSKLQILNSKLEKLLHKTIKKVTEDIENFRFNTAVSSLMILVNELEKQPTLPVVSCKLLTKLLAPFAPHISEELWQKIGGKKSIFEEKWPKYDPKLIKEEIITLIIQTNGRVRDKIEVETNITKEEAEKLTLSREKIKKYIANQKIKKIIFVPQKLINIVTEGG